MRILAYRFSAFGDVAMLVPVFREFLKQHPNVEILMLSRAGFKDLFHGIPRLYFKGVDLKKYSGVFGLKRLSDEVYQEFKPQIVGDFHSVLRSQILNFFFRLKGLPIHRLDKGRKEKKQLIRIDNLHKIPLKKNTERYADVLRKMGFHFELSHQLKPISENKEGIGFAPFAQHFGKMLPLEKSYELAQKLAENHKVYFFGGGKKENEILSKWEKEIPNAESLAGKLSLRQELEKIANLKVMVSMDSANMHLASLVGTRCVSVWGATHPFAGFLGYGQSEEDVVQIKDLTCRPCSIFGNKKCYRGDWACLNEIDIKKILLRINS
ncbi:MAG: glycosyltransferase family 9 protein [Flavobacteriaceae bacterium]|nr:glycosyltransferase family 9 protein [Flavobacteriaceae bacterium]